MKNKFIPAFFALSFLAACSKSALDNPSGGSTASGTITIVPPASVPAATITAFSNEFAGASSVEWQRSSSSNFSVQFNHNGQRHSAGYDDNGHRSSHSVICTDGPVPQVVLDAFRQQFPGDTVYEWNLRNDGSWKAHLMRAGVKYEATFSASGGLLKFERSA